MPHAFWVEDGQGRVTETLNGSELALRFRVKQRKSSFAPLSLSLRGRLVMVSTVGPTSKLI
jgi:hypothetical protein